MDLLVTLSERFEEGLSGLFWTFPFWLAFLVTINSLRSTRSGDREEEAEASKEEFKGKSDKTRKRERRLKKNRKIREKKKMAMQNGHARSSLSPMANGDPHSKTSKVKFKF